jgi:ATP-binding protein involved in chromosome partitioning
MTKQNNDCDSCAQKGSCKNQNDGQECTCKVDRLAKIKHKIIIASARGVGKSTVSVNLARALQMKGMRVGILDADITGPDIPKLLGIEEAKLTQGRKESNRQRQAASRPSHGKILTSRDSPEVWRGPMKMAAIKQFIRM